MRMGIAPLAIVVLALFASTAHAGPIETPIDLNDFFAHPTVTVAVDGSSADFLEDPGLTPVILENDPFLGDPFVIIPAADRDLVFDFEFDEGVPDDIDFFDIILFDSDVGDATSIPAQRIVESFDSDASGSRTWDLTPYVGQTLGLSFRLGADLFDLGFTSTARVSNVKLVDPDPNAPPPTTPPIPEPGTWALFGAAAVGAYIVRRRKRA